MNLCYGAYGTQPAGRVVALSWKKAAHPKKTSTLKM